MSTLIIRLTGPMQSWGLQSPFSDRDTVREPTKSGVLGLLCAALGKPRRERPDDGHPTLAELTALRMAVRVDREGQPRYDFQTAQYLLKASGTEEKAIEKMRAAETGSLVIKNSDKDIKDTEPSVRHYLAGAWFTVGLEGDRALLEKIDAALAAPVWPLALGRKAFPPGLPIRVVLPDDRRALYDAPLLNALASFRDPCTRYQHLRAPVLQAPVRVVVDADAQSEAMTPVARRVQPDTPLSFSPRRFAPREVIEGTLHPIAADVPD